MRIKVLQVVTLVFNLAIVPGFAFLVAELVAPAQLVGPYLLVSPMIAFAIAMFAAMPAIKRERREARVSDELTERAEEIGAKLGVKGIKLAFGRETKTVAGSTNEGVILICESLWGEAGSWSAGFLLGPRARLLC